jgi:hypothetical protein
MAKKFQEDDIVIHIIVILSILIETLIDSIKCLTSLNSRSVTPTATNCVMESNVITPIASGKTKTQRLSPSTKRRSTTAVQKKEDGGTKQDTPSSHAASSPRSKRSKSSSNSLKSTKSQTSLILGSRQRTQTTKSTSPTTTLRSTPNPSHITVDANSRTNQTSNVDN